MAIKRLDRILSEAGVATRSQIKEMVRRGRVTVNGVKAAASDMKLEETQAAIMVDDVPVRVGSYYYIMMNKPGDCVSATKDDSDRTVLDLLPDSMKRAGVFPVGRLDKDTTGLLLLTNDGNLGHCLTSPAKGVAKVYEATVEGTPTPEDVSALAEGVVLKDGTECLPAELEILETGETSRIRLTVTEGKYHLVKRLMASRGHRVIALKRLAEAGLALDEALLPGQWRELTTEELMQISAAIHSEKHSSTC